jgi:hypothetical protein
MAAVGVDVTERLKGEQNAAPARVSPDAAATSDKVCAGRVASNERITDKPRANDCT